ncbi:hypothetical protein BC830DRAFT_1163600 [Chytriomyces sp. MP71]|nr:hypothetical protein BC830DRAFT_1163600 [Chytriomyces sp. MP71]
MTYYLPTLATIVPTTSSVIVHDAFRTNSNPVPAPAVPTTYIAPAPIIPTIYAVPAASSSTPAPKPVVASTPQPRPVATTPPHLLQALAPLLLPTTPPQRHLLPSLRSTGYQLCALCDEVALSDADQDTSGESAVDVHTTRRLLLRLVADVQSGKISVSARTLSDGEAVAHDADGRVALPPSAGFTVLRGKPLAVDASVSVDSRVFQVGMRFFRAQSQAMKTRIMDFGTFSLGHLVAHLNDIVLAAATEHASITDTVDDSEHQSSSMASAEEFQRRLEELDADAEILHLLLTAIKQNQSLEAKLRVAERQRNETLDKLAGMQKRVDNEWERVVKYSEKVATL